MKTWTLLFVVLTLASGCKTVDGLLQKSGSSSVPTPSAPTPSVGSRTSRSDANDRRENERADKLRTSQECEDTTRVRQIKPDGTLVYDRKCKYVGKEWVENTHYPVWVAGDLAASIKPGTFVRLFSGGGQHKATTAQISVPIEVWDSKDRKRLMSYVAVPLAAR